MSPLEPGAFGQDPWWIILIKVLGVFVYVLVFTIFNVWFERRVVGRMQQRKGPTMNGPLGLPQTVAEAVKLLFKEDFRPKGADKFLFTLAPLIAGTAAFTAWSVIPIGGQVNLFGHTTQLQLTDLPMGVLFILSISAIGIYGVVLAGYSSTSAYSLLGSIRSTAQMISYEIAMGLSLVAVFLYAGSMSTHDIVEAQTQPISLLPGWHFSGWFDLLLLPSFVIYVISMVAETNRAPFDLVECEQELVSGYITDYSGFRYAAYFLAEYINMMTVSAVATTLFLGGYHAPWPVTWLIAEVPGLAWLDGGWFGIVWFSIKVLIFIFLYVWLRGALPRLRYDQFMHLGWKVLIPANLAWIVLVAVAQVGGDRGWFSSRVLGIVAAVIIVILVVSLFIPGKAPDVRSEVSRVPGITTGVFDPFADGYPVPPMPGQILPDEADVLVGPGGAVITAESEPEADDTGKER